MDDGRLDSSYVEDLSDYLVSVQTVRPHFHTEMSSMMQACQDRYESGDYLAIHDALCFCERGCLPLPPWLSFALKKCVVASLTGGFKGEKGRSKSIFGEAQKELRKKIHFQTVSRTLAIARTISATKLLSFMRFQDDQFQNHFPEKWWNMIQYPETNISISDFGGTLEESYLVTSKLMRGSFAQAEPRTIRKSYQEIRKRYSSAKKYELTNLNGERVEFTNRQILDDADPETLDAFDLQTEMNEAEFLAFEMGQDYVEPQSFDVRMKSAEGFDVSFRMPPKPSKTRD